jgi:hypothetical protein
LIFTSALLSIIRQQRHLATRVLIATQEPTLSPALIDLCNVTIVHRFLSPAWFEMLKNHLAGARFAGKNDHGSIVDIFRTIVGLKTGEALLFSPTALLDIGAQNPRNPFAKRPLEKMTDSYIRLFIRKRVTADGGKSIMASDGPAPSPPPDSSSDASGKDSSETSDSEAEVTPRLSSRFGHAAPAPRQRSHPPSKRQRLELQEPSHNLQDTPHQQKPTPQHFQPPFPQTPNRQLSKKAKNPPPPPKSPAQPQPQQVSKKAKNPPKPAKSPAQPQPQPQPQQVSKEAKTPPTPAKSPAQPQPQPASKTAKNPPTPAKSSAQPQPQQGQQQLTKKQKKALNKAALATGPQPQQGQQQLTKKQKKALNKAALAAGPQPQQQGQQELTKKQRKALNKAALATGPSGGGAGGAGSGDGATQQTEWIRQPGTGGRLSRSTTHEDALER